MITGAFGMTMDLERGITRQWFIGRDGVKRWADTNDPVKVVSVNLTESAPEEAAEAAQNPNFAFTSGDANFLNNGAEELRFNAVQHACGTPSTNAVVDTGGQNGTKTAHCA